MVLAVLALQLTVAGLLAVRQRERIEAPFSAVVIAAPAVIVGALVFEATPAVTAWPVPATVLFCLGAALAGIALLSLGRSFAVLPGVREVVARGPYRVCRHPAYLGEFVMVAACGFVGSMAAISLMVLTAAFLYVRIRVEERVLTADPAYTAYARAVPWRMLPGVW